MEYRFDGDNNLYGRAEREFSTPARVKQMGSIEDRVKIFVEDYVYTYLYQYGRSGGGKEKLAALIGRHYIVDGQETVVISGAIQGKGTLQENGMERFSEETWEYIGGQMQTYFKGMSIVGWVHCQPGFGAFLMAKDEAFHREYFKEQWQVLFVLDTVDKLDTFYLYNEEGNGLRQARGYFVYYDKNREMQEYMLENSMIRPKEEAADAASPLKEERAEETAEPRAEGERRRRKPTQEERMDAAQDIRRVLQKRERAVKQAKKEHDRLLATVSCVLCVVCVSLGLAMMQSLDRLRLLETELTSMQTSYQTLAADFEGVKVQSVFAVQEAEADKEEETEGRMEKYIVESGDSLRYISRKFYGDDGNVALIMEANGLEDANVIYEGQALWLPEK